MAGSTITGRITIAADAAFAGLPRDALRQPNLWLQALAFGATGFCAVHSRLPATLGDIAYFHPFQRAIIEKHLPASARLHEVANPIEAEPLGEKEDGAAGEIIFLGRLSEEKGVFLYASAMRKAGLTPVFVGDGPAAPMLKARFPRRASSAGTMRRACGCVCARPARSFFPRSGMRASRSRAGKPLARHAGHHLRWLRRPRERPRWRNGLWFRHMDEEDLARAIRVLMRDEVARAMSEAAYRRYWAEPFSIERHCARLEAFTARCWPARRPDRIVLVIPPVARSRRGSSVRDRPDAHRRDIPTASAAKWPRGPRSAHTS